MREIQGETPKARVKTLCDSHFTRDTAEAVILEGFWNERGFDTSRG